ncbi:MAG: hypothetical protein WD431_19860 [Cyclobacteriaceae bacterium]
MELVLGTEKVYSWATEDPMKLSRSFDKEELAPFSELKNCITAHGKILQQAYPEAQSKYVALLDLRGTSYVPNQLHFSLLHC